jgi:Trp operon repressor
MEENLNLARVPGKYGRSVFAKGNNFATLRKKNKVNDTVVCMFSLYWSKKKFNRMMHKLEDLALSKDERTSVTAISKIMDKLIPNPVAQVDVTMNAGLSKDEQAKILKEAIREKLL